MAETFYHLPVVGMAVVVFLVTASAALAIQAVVMRLAGDHRIRWLRALSPITVTPLSMLFGLIVSFLAAQVWTESDRAHAAVTREAMALRSIVVVAGGLPEPAATSLRSLVRHYVDEVVRKEWPAMANRSAAFDLVTAAEDEAFQIALSIRPDTAAHAVAQREIVASLRKALDARQERIVISRSTINWIKWTVVAVLAFLLLLTVAVVHGENRAAALTALTILAVAVTAAAVLIASHSRPFTGQISVGPELLLQVIPKE